MVGGVSRKEIGVVCGKGGNGSEEAAVSKSELMKETKAELIKRAREKEIPGRWRMTKEELATALAKLEVRKRTVRRRRVRSGGTSAPSAVAAEKGRKILEERARRKKTRTRERKAEETRVSASKTTKVTPPSVSESDSEGGRKSRSRILRESPSAPPTPSAGEKTLAPLPDDLSGSSLAPGPAGRKRRVRVRLGKKSETPEESAAEAETAPEMERKEESAGVGLMPRRYGRSRLVLMARDPRWLYAYWDLAPEDEQRWRKEAEEKTPGLKLRGVRRDNLESVSFEVEVLPGINSWYIPLPTSGLAWTADLGFEKKGDDRRFEPWLHSNVVETPEVPEPWSDGRVRSEEGKRKEVRGAEAKGGGVEEKKTPAAREVHLGRVRGVPGGTGARGARPVSETISRGGDRRRSVSPEEKCLETPGAFFPIAPGGVFSGVSVFGGPVAGVRSGAGIPEGKGDWRSGPVEGWEIDLPSSFGDFVSAHPGPAEDTFYFWIDCELIVFGGTEPDAEVTVLGKRVKLRPDGTFTMRLVLPPGALEIPAVAVKADKSRRIRTGLRVTRKNRSKKEV
ncbi:MAG: DUF4912 domain-containing protein [Candidatus Hydrogenedentota bacterium]|nr:MAG: DUF4912 domain-containing protein [Candidatus Hydrogenedentota bacterium]